MDIDEIRSLLEGKNVLIEGKWEFLEFDSAGRVSQVEVLDDLLIIYLDNQSKFVGAADTIRYENDTTLNFIKSTPESNEIIVFRVRIL